MTFADSSDPGTCTRLAGDAKGPICVSLDSPFVKKAGSNPTFDRLAYPEGRLEIDQLGTRNVAPLVVNGQLNPACGARHPGHRRHAWPDVALVRRGCGSTVALPEVAAEVARRSRACGDDDR